VEGAAGEESGAVTGAPGDGGDPVAALRAQLERLGQEKQDAWDRLVRTTADFDNYRKRTRKEIDDARIDTKGRVLREILPVIDNLERAVGHAAASPGDAAVILDGVKLVLRQFEQALERCEVKPVPAEGQPFDPNLHEAMGQVESAEHPPGTVVQVLQRGYQTGGRLLRPALVMIARAPAGGAPGADGGAGETRGGESGGEA
jgi:molecular chaperone GrpE